MGGFSSISAAGRSIQRLLRLRFEEQDPVKPGATSVAIMRTEDLDADEMGKTVSRPALTLYLYRINFNKAMRAAWAGVSLHDGRSHLALDLHFLLTAWGANAEEEHLILGRAMQAIEDTPILSGPLLMAASDWAANECLQLVLEDIETESLFRIFDSLPVDYRLSIPYIARVIRVDGAPPATEPPVVTQVTALKPGTRP